MKCPKCSKWIAPEAIQHDCGWRRASTGHDDDAGRPNMGFSSSGAPGHFDADGMWFNPCAANGCPLRGTWSREIYGSDGTHWWCFVHAAGESFDPQQITARIKAQNRQWLFALLRWTQSMEVINFMSDATLKQLKERLSALGREDLLPTAESKNGPQAYARQIRSAIVREILEGLQPRAVKVKESRAGNAWADLDSAIPRGMRVRAERAEQQAQQHAGEGRGFTVTEDGEILETR